MTVQCCMCLAKMPSAEASHHHCNETMWRCASCKAEVPEKLSLAHECGKPDEVPLRPECGGEYTHETFADRITELAQEVAVLVDEKNREYAYHDPLACWREFGLQGMFYRFCDKVHRWRSFLAMGGNTAEKWRTTFMDLAGYALCAVAWLESGAEDPNILWEGDDGE